jgi:putative nucleotidyltransferase with HDIG domain
MDAQAGSKQKRFPRFLIGLVTALLITAMFPGYETIESDYSVGMIWGKEDLIAPFSFPVYKSESVYKSEVEEAKRNIFPVFDLDPAKTSGQIDWLDSLGVFLTKLKKIADYENEVDKEKSLPQEKRTTSEQSLRSLKSELPLAFSDSEWVTIKNIYNPFAPLNLTPDEFKKMLVLALNGISGNKIIDVPKSFRARKISFIRNKVEELIDVSEVYDTSEVRNILRSRFKNYFKSPDVADIALKIAGHFVYPDLRFNQAETDKLVSAVVEAIPKTIGIVKENERIVSKHEPINEMTRLKLESYKRVRSEQMGSRDYWTQQFGRFLFAAILIALIAIFLIKLRPEVFNDNNKLIIISTVILLQCFFAYLSLNIEVNRPIEYMIFVPVAAMLLTIMFDARSAFFIVIIICLLVSAVRGGDYDILLPNMTASFLVIYSVRDFKNRSQIFVSMFYILLGYIIAISAIGMERYESFTVLKNQVLMASLNSLLSPILAYGLLLFYEKVFGIATDLVFLELTDFNHPLLRELASKAPGTFHHSIVMGNLAEQAAKEIGANQILTRVGCYYHDIGKTFKPNYFVENQSGEDEPSKHQQLNPSLSAKVIMSHVKNGIELAERYRLPKEVIDFIPMHHGTTLVAYFYEKAKADHDISGEAIHDYIYRYPGPKPQSKETGLVMLADGIEAATRAIEDPTPAKIETQIDEIIKSRFIEGELDECDLTLKDLIKIRKSFLKTLIGIHHQRIKYPESTE